MAVLRSGYDSSAQSQVEPRSRTVSLLKGAAVWMKDFISLTFFTGVPSPGLSLWNTSLILARGLLYVLYLLLVTGLIQALRAETPDQETSLGRVIGALVRDQSAIPGEPQNRKKRNIDLGLNYLEAEEIISRLAGASPPARTSSASPPASPPARTSSASPPASPPASTSAAAGETADLGGKTGLSFQAFSFFTFSAAVGGGFIAILLIGAGLLGVSLWIQCAHSMRELGSFACRNEGRGDRQGIERAVV